MKIYQFTEKQNKYSTTFTYHFGIYREDNESITIEVYRQSLPLFTESYSKQYIEPTGRIQYVF